MILDRFKLDGRVAIVTGAGRGIGRGIALAYAEAGADVVCSARSEDQIAETAEAVRERGRRALAVRCDVLERADLEGLIEKTREEFGQLDILVNNAGGWPPKAALRTSEKDFETAFRFNVTSAFLLTRFAVPLLAASENGGAIVNVSSAAGRFAQPGFAAYGTAKAALSFLTRNLAAEFAPKVRVNAIAVGSVETSALAGILDDSLRKTMEDATPMGRIGSVEDIAACALYLASPAGGWVTGKVFEVDGGIETTNFRMPTADL
ncbi:MAG: SDR family oxidoreductase [Myxococcota bacterium]|nr:SDR family oxidoreductase [Myxococcota bacterium]